MPSVCSLEITSYSMQRVFKPKNPNNTNCRGRLADFVLDWEDELPDSDLDLSDAHSCLADLSIVMGSTLQIVPAGNLPTFAKKYHENGKMVVINLQPTKHDKKADLIINSFVDNVMEKLFAELGLDLPEYNSLSDPTRKVRENRLEGALGYLEWTQSAATAKKFKALADKVDDEFKLKRKLVKKMREVKREEDEADICEAKAVAVDKFECPPKKKIKSPGTEREGQINGIAVNEEEEHSNNDTTKSEVQSLGSPKSEPYV